MRNRNRNRNRINKVGCTIDIVMDNPMSTTPVKLVMEARDSGLDGVYGTGNAFDFPGLDFDGTDNAKVAVGNITAFQTVSLWAKLVSVAGNDVFMKTKEPVYIMWSSIGTLTATNFIAGYTLYVNGVADTALAAGVWQMVTIVMAASEPASEVDIGNAFTAGIQCNGVIADVLIYNRALSVEEIQSIYFRQRGKFNIAI